MEYSPLSTAHTVTGSMAWRKTLVVFLYFTNFLPIPSAFTDVSEWDASAFIALRYLLITGVAIALLWPLLKTAAQRYRVHFARYIAWGFAVVVGTLILRAMTVIAMRATEFPENQIKLIDFAGTTPLWLVLPLFMLAAPLLEEIIFREILLSGSFSLLMKCCPAKVALTLAIVLSAGLFTWAHAPHLNGFALCVYFPLALALVWGYIASARNVLVSFTAHALNNTLATLALLALHIVH